MPHEESGKAVPVSATLTIRPDDLRHVRRMLREQIAGDAELLRDLADGPDLERAEVIARLNVVQRLTVALGPVGVDAGPVSGPRVALVTAG